MRSLGEELYRLLILQGQALYLFTRVKIGEFLMVLKEPRLWRDPFLYLGMGSLLLFVTVSLLPFSEYRVASLASIQDSFSQPQSFSAWKGHIAESPNIYFNQQNTLFPVSPTITVTPQVLGALIQGTEFETAEREVIEYVVQPGDNLSSIADKFGISLNTLLWANDLHKDSLLQIGQKLVILPVSGVIHHVQKEDTLSGIAKTYKAEVDKIVAFNAISSEDDIFIGDILIIPGGEMPLKYVPPSYAPLASSYFICPIGSPCRITQGLHWYNAVDISQGECGTPIYAAAAGQVQKVRLTNSTSKWAFEGLGNHLTILHPNGVVTYYGHIATAVVGAGQTVSQGQVVAYVGGSPGTPGAGRSTGCHLHFGVRGAKNPFAQ